MTLFHPPSFIGKKLNIALARLLYTAQDKIDINDASTEDKNSLSQFTASRFLRQLANYICINAPKIYSTQTEQKNATVLPVPKPFPQEVLRTVQSLGMCSDLDGVSRLQDEDRRSSHESDTAGLVDSVDAGLLLSKSPSFSTFCFTLRQDLYDKASPILTHIEAIVRKSITPAFSSSEIGVSSAFSALGVFDTRQHRAIMIETDWRPWELFDNEFGQEVPPLNSIITYTGFTHSAFAATCSDYIKFLWPRTGPFLLRALQKLIDSRYSSTIFAGKQIPRFHT